MQLIKAKNYDKIKKLYEESFPKEEKKPFDLILQKQKENLVEILSIESNNVFLGLIICAKYKDSVLLDYFALDRNNQSKGFGSQALLKLIEKYQDKKLFIEIEDTLKDSTNKEQRIRRKNFYLKNNLILLDFKVNLLGVEMEILSNKKDANFSEYIEIYHKVYGENFSRDIFLCG